MSVEKKTVIGFDVYNMAVTGGVSKTLNSIRSDSDHVPCILIFENEKRNEADYPNRNDEYKKHNYI